MLNLFLPCTVTRPPERARKHWVLTRVPYVHVQWVQSGYFIDGFEHLANALSPPISASMQTCSVNDQHGLFLAELTAPTELEELLHRAGHLSAADRDAFLRACYWYRLASSAWYDSQSLHLITLIQAIECLLPSGPEDDPTSKVVARFLDFMAAHAPGNPSRSSLDRLYVARSTLAHGSRVMSEDLIRSYVVNPASSIDMQTSDEASALVKGAMINWVWRRELECPNLVTLGPRQFVRTFATRVTVAGSALES